MLFFGFLSMRTSQSGSVAFQFLCTVGSLIGNSTSDNFMAFQWAYFWDHIAGAQNEVEILSFFLAFRFYLLTRMAEGDKEMSGGDHGSQVA